MENYYKISKSNANLIGRFEYEKGQMFDPFCSEQVDGTYLVSVDLVNELSDNVNIKKINWNNLTVISKNQINNKVVSI